MIRPMTAAELADLRQALRGLHTPLRTGPVQPNPYQPPTDAGGKLVCAGCGGVMWWPCPTRRLVDGEKVDLTLPELGAVGFGGPPGSHPPAVASVDERLASEAATVAS